jgi:hypothetical protein
MKCPACPANLQPLDPSTTYVAGARDHCARLGIAMPAHGPAALVMLALVSHAMVVHKDLDLAAFLEAYLDS